MRFIYPLSAQQQEYSAVVKTYNTENLHIAVTLKRVLSTVNEVEEQ